MYFPVGWPKYIKQPCSDLREPCHIISSCDRMLFAIVSEEEISIWYCKVRFHVYRNHFCETKLRCFYNSPLLGNMLKNIALLKCGSM